jgi:hypothetical protein
MGVCTESVGVIRAAPRSRAGGEAMGIAGFSKRTILRQERSVRRTERFAAYGRRQEQTRREILVSYMVDDQPFFDDVVLHPPCGAEDANGKDFTVRRGNKSVSFGMTISLKSWNRSKVLYPEIPQFCFPLNVRPETVISRILELFEDFKCQNK